jgi:Zn-dependent M28 family amino/carboxypeptidase
VVAAEAITPDLIRSRVRFLASDLLGGRGPATQGDALAQQYIATELEGLGLEPGASDGTYFQHFEMLGIAGHADTLAFVVGKQPPLVFKHYQDTVAVAGRPEPQTKVEGAELVFVGFGIVAPEYHWDDFKGLDVRGKVLLVLNNDPEDDPQLFEGRRRLWYGRWDYKFEQAAKLGAAGAIIVHTTASAGYPWQVVQTSWSGEQFDLPADGPTVALKGWLTEDATKRLLTAAGKDWASLQTAAKRADFKPVPLGVTVSTQFKNTVRRVKTANILARLSGSDPRLRDELVVYTAHHDHLGSKQPERPGEDVIYNGAEDNASGVAQMLAVARAFVALPKPPPRSVLFAAVAAEEQGLLGSQYLAEHPPVPVGKMAVNINIDGANIFGPTRDVTVIGLGKTDLDPLLTGLAAHQRRVLKPDAFPDRGFFYRSDQFNFAKMGVPSLYFEGGTDYVGRPSGWGKAQREAWEEHVYHQPSDELTPSWSFVGIVEDAKLFFWAGAAIARQTALPGWKKGDEFEAARLRAVRDAASPGSGGGAGGGSVR